MNSQKYCFPVFKGLQKPLEFMGLRGRFISLAAVGIGVSLIGSLICMVAIGQIPALIFLFVSGVVSFASLYIKQKQGLHYKKKCKDVLVYHNIFIK